MRPIFKCPKCGYKNYLTKEDMEEKRKFKRDDSKWFFQNIKETWHNIVDHLKEIGRTGGN